MAKTAYSYIRFSTPEQAKGDSLKRQLEASEQYARDNGLVIDTTLRDLGKSAFKSANAKDGKLGDFLARVQSGEISKGSVLIVESLDRLSRDTVMNALPSFIALIQSGITVVTLGSSPQRYDSATIAANPYILIGSLLEMVRANEESQRKSDRLGAVWGRKKLEAGKNGPITKRAPAWLEVKNGEFRGVKGRSELIQRIFEMTIGGHGKGAIAKIFNEEKTPSFGKSGWHPSYLQKILTNRAVFGEYQPMTRKTGKRAPDGEPVANYFPEIVTEDVFLRAQRARNRRNKTGGRPSEGSHAIFTGLIKCGHCGGSVVSVTKNKAKGWVYLVCDNARRGRGCEYHSWGTAAFEEVFLNWIVDFDFSEKAPNKELASLEKAVNSGEIAIIQVNSKIENLVKSLELNQSKAITERLKELEADKAKKITAFETTRAGYLDLLEKNETVTANQKEFRKIIKNPASRERLRNELKKRITRMTMVFNENEIEFHEQPFCEVVLITGETYHLLKDGEAMIWMKGKRYTSKGLE